MKSKIQFLAEQEAQQKSCSQCGALKSYSDFNSKKNSRDKLRSECKACCLVNSNRWKNNNTDKSKASYKKWREKNIDRERAVKREYAKNNVWAARNRELKRQYGISYATFNIMRVGQLGLCLICKEPTEKLVVDHCHETGHVRGLLCGKCNSAIGLFKDNIENLKRAVEYLTARKSLKAPIYHDYL